MRKRFMKPVLFGTLAIVASAIVAGPAFGRVFTPNTSQNQGSPPSQHAQQSKLSIPGNGVFPDLQRLRSLLTPAERGQLDAVAATARSIDQQQGSISSSGGSGFNWDDAGVGIGIGLAIAGGLVLVAILGIRRDKATPAPA